jgi:hypothetical protein
LTIKVNNQPGMSLDETRAFLQTTEESHQVQSGWRNPSQDFDFPTASFDYAFIPYRNPARANSGDQGALSHGAVSADLSI